MELVRLCSDDPLSYCPFSSSLLAEEKTKSTLGFFSFDGRKKN